MKMKFRNEIKSQRDSCGFCATFRYIPPDDAEHDGNLNILNETLLNELQAGGQVFLSNAIVNEKYCLRACIVNFRTSQNDIKEIVEIVVKLGREIHLRL